MLTTTRKKNYTNLNTEEIVFLKKTLMELDYKSKSDAKIKKLEEELKYSKKSKGKGS